MPGRRPASSKPLRKFLRERCSKERLRRIASADYDRDGDGIAAEFQKNLDSGEYSYRGDGNPYECALMQRHDSTPDRPLNELFGAWWIGSFCSDPRSFVLIENLATGGVAELLRMLVCGCGNLGPDAAKAAHATLAFVEFLRARTPRADDRLFFDQAVRALEAIKKLGPAGTESGRYRAFMGG